MRHAYAIFAAAVCIAGGLSLLGIEAQEKGLVFVSMAHGIGVYCIGKGLYVGAALWPSSAPPRLEAI